MITKGVTEWDDGLKYACIHNHYDIVLLITERGPINLNWNDGLFSACWTGNLDTILLLIKMGANNWNDGLSNACRGGNRDIALLMIEKGANDFNSGLINACIGGYHNTDTKLIEMGAREDDPDLSGNLLHGPHRNLAVLMIRYGADINNCTLKLIKCDIMHLVQSKIRRFGSYESMAQNCKLTLILRILTLRSYLINDLMNIVVDY